MDVYEAVTSRRAVRGFTDRPVPKETLERVLSAAADNWACFGAPAALFCGMSIGFEDTASSHVRTGRAPLGETVTFVSG